MNGAGNYQAEEGMTWQQWIGSKYDTDGTFSIQQSDNTIWFTEANAPISANNSQVFASDIIINGLQYDVYGV